MTETKSDADLKRETAIEFLEKGILTVELDARLPGVACPPTLQNSANLRLNFAYRYKDGPPTVNAWGIRQTLHFAGHGGNFECAVPWAAVFAMISHPMKKARVFGPLTFAAIERTQAEAASTSEEQADPPGTIRRGHLRLVS